MAGQQALAEAARWQRKARDLRQQQMQLQSSIDAAAATGQDAKQEAVILGKEAINRGVMTSRLDAETACKVAAWLSSKGSLLAVKRLEAVEDAASQCL